MHMTNHETVRLLRDFKQTKKDMRDLRTEMLRVAVEELGINKKEAQKINLETFLDGYLVGQEMMESFPKMTNYQISALLRHFQQTKKEVRNLHVDMLRVAVDELGMEQNEALQANLEVFLDGYLVGQGMMQSWRKRSI